MPAIIEEASLADADVLAALHKISFAFGGERPWKAKDFNNSISSDSMKSFIINIDDLPVGYILFQQVVDESEIVSFCIVPRLQRQGAATKLLDYTIEYLRARDVKRIVLDVREDNYGAIQFYRRNGFQEVGQRKNYYRLTNREYRAANILSLIL